MSRRNPASLLFSLPLAVIPLAPAIAQEPSALTVYTYNSFTSEWGPGPAIESGFEAVCGCDLRYVSVDDGVSILTRLRLEDTATEADVIVGLDTNLTTEALATGLLQPHGIDDSPVTLPIAWSDDVFVPFDYGYFAFVYDSDLLPNPPESLRALADSDIEILIQDPRTSTPGLGLLLWVRAAFADEAGDVWGDLNDQVVTVTSGWSEAYGLFLEGEAPMVLSYTTSPAYHRAVEGTDRYRAAAFAEGHYLQVEVAAMVANTDVPDLARAFLAYLISPEAQAVLPTTNWMYPAAAARETLPDAFTGLVEPAQVHLLPSETVHDNRRTWIDDWLAAMSR